MNTNIVIDISSPIPYLAKFQISSYGPKYCQPIKLQYSLKCNIWRKKWMIQLIFGMQINIEVFYKLIISFWVSAARHAQSTQNKKLSYLCNIFRKTWGIKLIFCLLINAKVCNTLQYLKENVKDEVDFLRANKRQRFLQIDTVSLSVCAQACPNYPK